MKTIFQAMRGLRKFPNFGLPMNAQDLSAAMLSFERTNRGHQHELDDLALGACYPTQSGLSEQFRARMWSFRASLDWLLDSAASTPASSIPDTEAFQAFWTAKDETGALAYFTLERLKHFIGYQLRLPDSYRLASSRLELKGGTLNLALSIQHRTTQLYAEREFTFPCHGLDTFLGCTRTMREFRRQAADHIATLGKWPEFSAERQNAATASRCRRRMTDFLATCSAEEREWYATNWSHLRTSPSF